MPQEIAATWSRSGSDFSMERVFIQAMASCSATQAPVMEAVRVPPSAWITSQSMVIWRSPSATRSTTERNERPIRRWISTVRQPFFQAGGHQHMGVAEFHEAGAFGIFHDAALERNAAQFVDLSSARPHRL